jgi:hypothetical protein
VRNVQIIDQISKDLLEDLPMEKLVALRLAERLPDLGSLYYDTDSRSWVIWNGRRFSLVAIDGEL